jgi:hypothetical protein
MLRIRSIATAHPAGMKIVIEKTSSPLTSHAGLYHVGMFLKDQEFRSAIRNAIRHNRAYNAIDDVDIICCMLALYSLGKTDYDDIEQYRNDRFFRTAIGVKRVPSAAALRQRMETMPEEITVVLREFNMAIIAGGFEQQVAERKKNRNHEETVEIDTVSYAIIDSDVTVLDNSDSKKEGVNWTYKKCDGYAPMISYIGRSGYMLNNELREGSMHSNCEGTAEYFTETITMARAVTDAPLLMVLDSGNDDRKLVDQFEGEEVFYVIKRNLRKESVENWLETAKQHMQYQRSGRDGSTVYYASIVRPLWEEKEQENEENRQVRVVVVARERYWDADGQMLLVPEMRVETYWTNLACAETVVESVYHRHGTSEQYHAELKSDLGVERLPSGKFYPNMLHLLLAMLAFNILRRIGTTILLHGKIPGKRGNRLRLRTVLQNVMYMAGLIISHAGRMILRIFDGHAWSDAVLDYS